MLLVTTQSTDLSIKIQAVHSVEMFHYYIWKKLINQSLFALPDEDKMIQLHLFQRIGNLAAMFWTIFTS